MTSVPPENTCHARLRLEVEPSEPTDEERARQVRAVLYLLGVVDGPDQAEHEAES